MLVCFYLGECIIKTMCLNLNLNNRLKLCADMVIKGKMVIDIGTDHAYLPIWLVLNNVVDGAIAIDLREEPLKRAVANIEKYKLEAKIKTRISNGFENINPVECETVVIAGMGGETIALILDNAAWIKECKDLKLILQPMKSAEKLRRYLLDNGYYVLKEKAVESNEKFYSVMDVRIGTKSENNLIYPYVGKIFSDPPMSAQEKYATIKYSQKEIVNLTNRLKGLKINGKNSEAAELNLIINEIKKEVERYNDYCIGNL